MGSLLIIESESGKGCKLYFDSVLPSVKEVPIKAVTAGIVLGEKEGCLDAGMYDYISKPAIIADFQKMFFK
ncbi:MAG: hypothetical protein SH817_07980 [Leptospira sp.]|nr:hypothetical protein [Leptospira sp.]